LTEGIIQQVIRQYELKYQTPYGCMNLSDLENELIEQIARLKQANFDYNSVFRVLIGDNEE